MTSNKPVIIKNADQVTMRQQKFFGVSITLENCNDILQYLLRNIAANKKYLDKKLYVYRADAQIGDWHSYKNGAVRKTAHPFVIFTPNPEQIIYAQLHQWYKALLLIADLSLPDGIGLIWGLNFLFGIDQQRITGIDFMDLLIMNASKQNLCIALLGGNNTTAEKTLQYFKKKYSGLKGWSQELPTITANELTGELKGEIDIEMIRKRILSEKTDIVFVALGAPKQEIVIQKLALQCPVTFMSVGGAFDIFSGRIQRAPVWMQSIHLEWLWRLVHEPWRIGRQINLLRFVMMVLREKFM